MQTLQSKAQENPLKPFLNLVALSELRQAQVENFSRQQELIQGDISAANLEILKKIEAQMKAQKWRKLSTDLDEGQVRLHFQFEFEGGRWTF